MIPYVITRTWIAQTATVNYQTSNAARILWTIRSCLGFHYWPGCSLCAWRCIRIAFSHSCIRVGPDRMDGIRCRSSRFDYWDTAHCIVSTRREVFERQLLRHDIWRMRADKRVHRPTERKRHVSIKHWERWVYCGYTWISRTLQYGGCRFKHLSVPWVHINKSEYEL